MHQRLRRARLSGPEPPAEPHCLRCKHHAGCVLPQKLEGRVCGWYNADVGKAIRRERPKHRIGALSVGR